MRVSLIDLSEQHRALAPQIKEALARIVDSQQFVLKDNVSQLERLLAEKLGTRHGIGLASGSDALYLALRAMDIGPGAEVLTTPFTFFATAGAVSRAGAVPVFADVDPGTLNLDAASAERKIGPKTRAIIPVHLFGLPCDMDAIQALARRRKLRVVEDAAQSIGAAAGGRQTGSIGDAGCLSFYPTKNLGGAGDGGMLVTSSDELADRVRLLRDHGSRKRYHHDEIGINSRLDEMQAAVLLIKLARLDQWTEARRRHARAYADGLKGLPLELPAEPAGLRHVYHLYTVQCDRRDALGAYLAERGIGSGVYYPIPLHLQRCYRDLGYKPGDLPVSERACHRVLSLPMYPELDDASRDEVIAAVREFFGRR